MLARRDPCHVAALDPLCDVLARVKKQLLEHSAWAQG